MPTAVRQRTSLFRCAAMMTVCPEGVHMELYRPFTPHDLSKDLVSTGSAGVRSKGVNVSVSRRCFHYTDPGWYGPDDPQKATKQWGDEMLEATAQFLADYITKFSEVEL